ncbi:MAG: acyl-ACP--UDP-N-acetylglucosamine O-acyltransferase [Akkermansiaceae bacterium]|nr:acyl-ACP--UDP-N-acetylglucosamine O-acyltransferase [Akkermansiaceae bacterium]
MPDIHSTALVSDAAQLADDVTVGPYSIIDGPAVIGPGCSIGAQAWIAGQVTMGSGNSIGHGVVIGSDPQDLGFDSATESGVTIGDGNTIREYATIHRGSKAGGITTIGNRNFIMVGAHFGHDVAMGDENVIANNVLFAGHVTIGNQTFIGGGAMFHQFLRVGDLAIAQGKAGVGKDVPPFCVVHSTNRLGGLNVVGMRRAGLGPDERKEIKSAYALLFQSGKNLSEAVAEAGGRSWGPHARKLIDAVQNPTKRGVLSRQA